MGLRINTNVASLNAQRNLSKNTGILSRSFMKLSTGRRIAVAADDAAGLAISERLKAKIRSLDQAQRNAQDGISLVQTAEGSLQEVNDILVRMRELAIQAKNGTTSPADKDTLNQEFQALIEEVDRIAKTTDFNETQLLDGSVTGGITLQIGADVTTNDVLTVGLVDVQAGSTGLAIDTLDIGSTGDYTTAINTIDSAIDTVSQLRGDLGAVQNRLDSVIANLAVNSENLSAANSRIVDVDVAQETANLTKYSILQQAAISVLAQANVQPQAALSLLQG